MIDPSLLQGKKGTDYSDQKKDTQKGESKRVADGQLPPSPSMNQGQTVFLVSVYDSILEAEPKPKVHSLY